MPPAVAGASESRHDSPRFGPWRRLATLAVLLCAAAGGARAAETSLAVSDGLASGRVMLLASRDMARPQSDIVRAVITIHGLHRDAGHYDAIARQALAMAGPAGQGTLLLTPRFAGAGHGGPADLLRWPGNTWMDGQPATAPAPLSSFAVMDGLLARLSDRRLFPALATVVLVGHSAGGQFVQRYAMLGHGLGPAAAAAGLAVRFVVANLSSYAYPDRDRPTPAGGFAPGPATACPGYDRWKYGLEALPAYAGAAPAMAVVRAYVARDVTILLGSLDDDPALAVLDTSCAAEAEGPTHLARGRDFVRLLRSRYAGAPHQRLHEIAGVGHDAAGMLTSACALAAIYGTTPCETRQPAAGGL